MSRFHRGKKRKSAFGGHSNKESLMIENAKNALFLKGTKTSQVVTDLLKNWALLKKPCSKALSGRNANTPFDNESSIEFLCSKNDCGLFTFGSHSKKRPHNIVMGRTFDNQLLDMMEFGIENFISIDTFKGVKGLVGGKPMFIFQGDLFEQDDTCASAKSLILDFFRGQIVTQVALSGLSHVCVCTANAKDLIAMRWYTVAFRKSGSSTPRVELLPMGPFCDLRVRRTKVSSADLMKLALKQPKELAPKRKKNIATNKMGDVIGRIHIGQQDFDKIQTRKEKALRIGKDEVQEEQEEEEDEEEEEEEEEDDE